MILASPIPGGAWEFGLTTSLAGSDTGLAVVAMVACAQGPSRVRGGVLRRRRQASEAHRESWEVGREDWQEGSDG